MKLGLGAINPSEKLDLDTGQNKAVSELVAMKYSHGWVPWHHPLKYSLFLSLSTPAATVVAIDVAAKLRVRFVYRLVQ